MKGINVLLAEGNEKIKSCPLFKTKRFDATLLIIQQGHQVPPHTSSTNAMILMLNNEITVLETGDVFTFSANEIHALQALETSRIILIK